MRNSWVGLLGALLFGCDSLPTIHQNVNSCPVTYENKETPKTEKMWQPPTLWGEPTVGGTPTGLRLGDFDADGFDDVVTVDSVTPAWASMYLFPQVEPRSFPEDKIKGVVIADLSVGGESPRPSFADFVSGDFDEDGLPDLALANNAAGDVRFLHNYGKGYLFDHRPHWIDRFAGRVTSLATADVNGDKHLDLVGTNAESNDLMLWLGDGKGSFSQQAPVPFTTKPSGVTLADLNQDGHIDILTSFEIGEVSWLLGDGRGAFTRAGSRTVCTKPRSLQVADLDKDGLLDWAIVCPQAASVEVSFDPIGLAPRTQQFAIPAGEPTSLALSDLDMNGQTDLVVAMAKGENIYLLMNQSGRSGTFSAPLPLLITAVPSWSYPFAVVTSDINRDGYPDIIVAHRRFGGIAILLSNPL